MFKCMPGNVRIIEVLAAFSRENVACCLVKFCNFLPFLVSFRVRWLPEPGNCWYRWVPIVPEVVSTGGLRRGTSGRRRHNDVRRGVGVDTVSGGVDRLIRLLQYFPTSSVLSEIKFFERMLRQWKMDGSTTILGWQKSEQRRPWKQINTPC